MKTKMAPPWIIFVREIEALFEYDEEISIDYDDQSKDLKIYVDSADKADALLQLLPAQKEFGNVTLNIIVIPANQNLSKFSLLQKAFNGNSAVSDIEVMDNPFEDQAVYVLFEPSVVQYKNDDIGDFNGICSTLYQNIAADIIKDVEGLHFCTSTKISY